MLPPETVAQLAEALGRAGYTYDGVRELLGPQAFAALHRNETTAGLRRAGDGSALAILTRLWPLQDTVSTEEAERALPELLDALCVAGLLEQSVGTVQARLDVRPYADESRDWWVVSDLTPGLDGTGNLVGADYVLGVSSASTTLASLTVREPVDRALDLGTGSGVQALHLAAHAGTVVATDVNRRALAMARLNAQLNGIDVDVRHGSLFEPVAGESFELIVSNPPFVVSPGTGEHLVYRDSGLPGDELVRRLLAEAPAHLADGGWCQLMANWMHVDGIPWQERLESVLAGNGCDAWVVQREVADPAAYVELWLRDAGHDRRPDYRRRYDAWLSWLDEQGATGIGFGWVSLHRTGGSHRRFEDWPYEVEQPLGPEIADWGRRIRAGGLMDRPLVRRSDVRQETFGAPGAEDPETIVLRQQRGMRRANQVDTAVAGLVGACDGDLTPRQLESALERILGQELDLEEQVRELLEEGFLTLPEQSDGPEGRA